LQLLEMPVETDRIDRLRAFGQELRTRRKSLGIDQKVLAARLGISNQHLSQLETAYDKPGRGPVGPSDKVISAIAETLNWRKNDIHDMLGRLDDEEPSDDVVRAALPIAEAYWRLTGKDRRIADELLGTVITDPPFQTVDPFAGSGARFPIKRETIFRDDQDFARAAYDGRPPTKAQIAADKARIEERRQQREDMDFSPAARELALKFIRAWCNGKGDRDIKEVVDLKHGADAELPYQADVKIVWQDGAVSDDYFNLNLETGAVRQIVEDDE
jgi:transcriptional regulator with XRE-family HTH domain